MVDGGDVVESQEKFGVLVTNCFERSEFTGQGRGVLDCKSDLKVEWTSAVNDNEINFFGSQDADKDILIAPLQFKEDDVFENMSLVIAFVSEKDAAESCVGDVVLGIGLQVVFSFDVIATDFEDEKGFAKCREKVVERGVGNGESVRFERSNNAIDGLDVADMVEDESCQSLKSCGFAESFASGNIFIDNCRKNAGKVVLEGTRSCNGAKVLVRV